MSAEAEYHKRCDSQLAGYRVMHEGAGAWRVTWTAAFNYKDAVAVPTEYVALPSGARGVAADLGERSEFSGMQWFKEDEIITLLSGLK
jgi:hypothetical protein